LSFRFPPCRMASRHVVSLTFVRGVGPVSTSRSRTTVRFRESYAVWLEGSSWPMSDRRRTRAIGGRGPGRKRSISLSREISAELGQRQMQ
jgi:hypothetical protein